MGIVIRAFECSIKRTIMASLVSYYKIAKSNDRKSSFSKEGSFINCCIFASRKKIY